MVDEPTVEEVLRNIHRQTNSLEQLESGLRNMHEPKVNPDAIADEIRMLKKCAKLIEENCKIREINGVIVCWGAE